MGKRTGKDCLDSLPIFVRNTSLLTFVHRLITLLEQLQQKKRDCERMKMPSADKSYMEEVLSLMLDCSQCFERGFLSLCYSCHTSNIHALIWSLTSQSF